MKKTKAKKFLIIFIVLILLISTSAFIHASSVIEDPINISFQDKNLYTAIKLYFEAEGLKYSTNEATLTVTVSEAKLNNIKDFLLSSWLLPTTSFLYSKIFSK